jgi:hypothetical protein
MALAPASVETARKITFLAGCIIFFLLFVSAANLMLSDPDTFWHIRSGQTILATWRVPTEDAWSWTEAGKPWIAKEWLSQVLLAMAYDLGGWNGVMGLSALSIALTFAMLAWFLSQRFGKWLTIFCLAAAFVTSSGHMLARPHALAYPLQVIWFAGLARASERGKAPHLGLAAILVVWANMHGGFTLGLAYAFGFAITSLWEAEPEDRVRLAWSWALFLALSMLAIVVTPYGFESALITAKLFGFGQRLTILVEWMPPNFSRDKGFMIAVLSWVAIALTIGARFSPPRLLMILGLLYLFFSAQRNGELLGFVLPFLIRAPQRSLATADVETSGRSWRPVLVIGLVAFLGSMATARFVRPDLKPIPSIVPQGCVDFASTHGLLEKRLYNAYEYGGFLIWKDVKTYIDGRAELYGSDRLEEYSNFQLLLGQDPLKPLDRDGIAWTMFNPHIPVTKALDLLPGWERAYREDLCVVHVRKAAVQ